jgi:hypothetical protein
MIKIILKGAYAYLEGDFPYEPVLNATSFLTKNYQFSPKYSSGRWDGRIRLYQKLKRRFPIGLAQDVMVSLRMADCRVCIEDQRDIPPHITDLSQVTLNGVNFDPPYDFQMSCANEIVKKKNGIINLATNCVAADTLVIVRDQTQSRQPFTVTVAQLYDFHHQGWRMKVSENADHVRLVRAERILAMNTNHLVKYFKILDVIYSGEKLLYEITTNEGKQIKVTLDHRFYSIRGWQPLSELKIDDFIYVRNNNYNSVTQILAERIKNIRECGLMKTYDIEVDEVSNFIGNEFVLHNSGKSEISALVTKALRIPTLFITPSKELLYQTRDRFSKRLEIKTSEIGLIGDNHFNLNPWITIGTMQTLNKRLNNQEFYDYLQNVKLIICDECHKSPAGTYYEVVMNCPAPFRLAMSGTPLERTDGQDLKLIAAIGPVIYEIKNKYLTEKGISNKAEIWFFKILRPRLHPRTPWPDVYKEGIVRNQERNTLICELVRYFVGLGKSVVVFINEIEHGRILEHELYKYQNEKFTSHKFIHGSEDMWTRRQAVTDFKENKLKCIISSRIISEGVDIPNIDVLIRAEAMESSIKTLQTVGRGLRKGGTSDTLIVADFADLGQYHLVKHSLQRFEDYKDEDCFEMKDMTDWYWRGEYKNASLL